MAKLVSDKDAQKIYDQVNTLLGTDYEFSGFGDDMPVSTGLFQDVITVFNYHGASGLWYPTVITNAHVLAVKASTHATDGFNNADTVEVHITSNKAQNVGTPDGSRSYMAPKDYAVTAKPSEYITFTPERDFFYVGRWDDLTPVEDDDYDEGFYHAMNVENDGVHLISSASYFGLIPHFELGGR